MLDRRSTRDMPKPDVSGDGPASLRKAEAARKREEKMLIAQAKNKAKKHDRP